MDNKNNRLHYWNVKDFLEKQPEMPAVKIDTLKNSINSVIQEKSEFRQSNFVNNPDVVKNVSSTVSEIVSDRQKYQNNNVGQSKNVISNPFYMKK